VVEVFLGNESSASRPGDERSDGGGFVDVLFAEPKWVRQEFDGIVSANFVRSTAVAGRRSRGRGRGKGRSTGR